MSAGLGKTTVVSTSFNKGVKVGYDSEPCTKWWHKLFHMFCGSKESVSTCNYPGSLPYVDYSYSFYSCGVCNSKWCVDHKPEIQEWEKIRDAKLKKGK